MATIEGWRAAVAADAPSGLGCSACGEFHESATAEQECLAEAIASEAEDWVGPLGTTSDVLALIHPTKLMRLVEGYYDGQVDAAEVWAAIREAKGF